MLRTFGAITLLTAFATGALPQSAPTPERNASMHVESIETNKQVVRKLFDTCFNQGQIDLLYELVAPEYVGPRGETGPGGFASTIKGILSAVPDIHYTVEDVVAEGDRVVVRWKWEGTQKGPFRGFPATQKHIVDTGIAIFRIDGGKIAQGWLQTDQLGFLQQIGAVPVDVVPAEPQKK
jgi:steroid delta-isomerase-like uncharacterized protein